MKTILLLTIALLVSGAYFGLYQKQDQDLERRDRRDDRRDNRRGGNVEITGYGLCPQPDYRSEQSFQQLFRHITNERYGDEKLQALKDHVHEDPRVLSQQQIIKIVDELRYANLKIEAMDVMNSYVGYLKCEDIVPLLESLTYANVKIDFLKVLTNYIIDATEENIIKFVDIAFYRYQNVKEEAIEILRNNRPMNCLFGRVTENVVTFVIDVSGSMNDRFTTENGRQVTRLEYVKDKLNEIISEQLQSYQKFNIITFASRAQAWQTYNVSVDSRNISSAQRYIDDLRVRGGTNISEAIKYAAKDSSLEAIYLLTDGAPNEGIRNERDMVRFVQEVAGNDLKIHTVSFMLGGTERQRERTEAQQILESIAQVTKGSYRQLE